MVKLVQKIYAVPHYNPINFCTIQGGSVMCIRTLCSDPAHLHFSLNCLPNEEEIKELTYQHIVQQTTKRIKQSTLKGL